MSDNNLDNNIINSSDNHKKNKPKKSRAKKILGIVENTFYAIIILLLVYVIIGSLGAKNSGKRFYPFGLSFNLVITDSMEPEIKVGDLAVCRHCDISEAEQDDNIIFVAKSGAVKGNVVIHKVINIKNENGEVFITTQGVNAPGADKDLVSSENFCGIELFHSSFLGWIFKFFSSWINVVFVVVIYITLRVALSQLKKLKSEFKLAKEVAIQNEKQQMKAKFMEEIAKEMQQKNSSEENFNQNDAFEQDNNDKFSE